VRVSFLTAFFIFFLFVNLSKTHAAGFCFNRAAEQYGLPVQLLYAIAKVESDFNPQAIDYDSNGSYDYGVMQINTVWYPAIRNYWNYLADPCYNVTFGAWILKGCYFKYGSIRKAVACYHMGEGNINAKAIKARGYIEKVAYYYQKYSGGR
jgi:soluble lytic murein transglycosylase-like protein